MSNRPQSSGPRGSAELRWQIWAPWLALLTVPLSATRTDPDLWGHVRFGLDWLDTWRLPSIDPYSFTQDRPWVNHEWLSEAFMGLAYRIGGSAGLVVLKMAIGSAAVTLMARRLRGSSPLVIAILTSIAVVGALPITATIRPQLWSLLALELLVSLLSAERPTIWRILAVSGLFAAWANFHGGWITGGAVLALHIIMRVARNPRHAWPWLVMGITSLAATLANPYGFGLWRFLGATVRASRPDISEWRAFSIHEPAVMWVSILGPLSLLALGVIIRRARPEPEAAAGVLLLVLAGLRVSRVAPLMCPAAMALLAPGIGRSWGQQGRLRAADRSAGWILLLPAVLIGWAAWLPVSRVAGCLPTDDAWAPDLTAAAALVGTQGRLWTTFDWGQFAIWHFGPALKVSIDGRRETVYSDATVEWNRAAEEGRPDAIARMLGREPEYVWLPESRQAARLALLEGGYRLDVQGPSSFILTRKDLPPLDAGRRNLSACFP